MMFWVWHILAICTVITISFGIGYSVGAKDRNTSKGKRWG
jgi:hypothetical protein